MTKQLYLIDATAFCYRAFYALAALSTSSGQPTNAVYGFLTMLARILKDHDPEYLAVCFDVSRRTFRTEKFAAYKQQRKAMPDELASQIPFIKEIVRAYRIALFEQEGFEADDVIATLASKASEHGLRTVIVSSDKDMLQMVDERVRVYNPYKDDGLMYDPEAVRSRLGVDPCRVPDVLALMGDASDNIPQVPGVGEKTAVSLIAEYGTVENLLKRVSDVRQERVRASLISSKDQIVLNKELVTLNRAVPLDFDPGTLTVGKPDTAELFRIFRQLELKKFLKEIAGSQEQDTPADIPFFDDTRLQECVRSMEAGEEIFLAAGPDGGMYACTVAPAAPATGDVFGFDPATESARQFLADEKVPKVGHDLKRIKVSLGRRGIACEGLFFDTSVAGYVLNPGLASYRLADLVWHYLGEPVRDELSPAASLHAVVRLRRALEEKLSDAGLCSLFWDLEMPLVSVLAGMEMSGVKIDCALLRSLAAQVEEKLAGLIRNIYSLSGCEFNINSPKQLSQVLFGTLKLPVIKKTKTGASTDEEVLRQLSRDHPLPALLLEYRQLSKLKSTYIDVLPAMADQTTSRIHASFNQTGTETGRLSSSNPNLQNIPVKTDIGSMIRRAFVAGNEQQLLVSCDYSQIELRILAHMTGDERLIAAFRQGADIHRATAALIYGMDNEQSVSDTMRETAKRVNFGIIYGLTSFGLSKDLKVSATEAQAFIDAYFLRYPRVQEYISAQIARARADGFVTTLLGRKRYIPEINNRNIAVRQFAERQAVNTPIQGSAADMIKLAMLAIERDLRAARLQSRMILQIHDELVFEVGREEFDRVLTLARERMERVMPLCVPVRVDIKAGKNWLDMKKVES
jgi:DNA polymerase-1